jgi:hypothetical protein
MSPKTPDTTNGVSPPPTEMQSAHRPPAAYQIGSSPEETQELLHNGYGTAVDLIHARGVPDFPSTNLTMFDKAQCTLILIEISFCMDFDCDIKSDKKIEKYSSLLATLRRH